MRRDVAALTQRTFDLVIVGGGIYGVCVAWDAVLRGLSVALLEQGDFGQATSANSMKITHGGFRYLQHGDVKRMRESIRERRAWLRNAPHLVHQLPFLIPTTRRGVQHRWVMRVALWLYDLIAFDRNHGVQDASKHIPGGRIVSREECLRLAPGVDPAGVTGGAVWQDGQVYNTERMTLAILRSAVEHGARAVNYAQVTGPLHEGRRVTGVTAVDLTTGKACEVRGRLVVNTGGPWINEIFERLGVTASSWRVPLTKTVNLITRPLTNRHAVSVMLPHRDGADCRETGCCRRLYITPWRGVAVVGSLHVPLNGRDVHARVTTEELDRLVADLNAAYPGGALRREDILFVHSGLLPRDGAVAGQHASRDHLSDHYEIHDHAASDGVEGLLSVKGVKYSTARDVAEKVVALALKKLGKPAVQSRSASTPVHGAPGGRFDEFLAGVLRERPDGLGEDVLRQLVSAYGASYTGVLEIAAREPGSRALLVPGVPIIKAQVLYAIQHEMAWTLTDVVFRRTELGSLGFPGAAAVRACAQVMAAALDWDVARVERELERVDQTFADLGLPLREPATAR